jgi:predicted component of type VI protein secretion system
LNDLKGSMDGRVAFEELLEQTVRDADQRRQLADEIKKFKEGKTNETGNQPR